MRCMRVGGMAGKISAVPLRICTLLANASKPILTRSYSSKVAPSSSHEFGMFFDIDGVIMRGKTVLPSAREAFRLLTDSDGRFQVPAVFVTNSGNAMRHEKAQHLSRILDISVSADQVVMAHSPLHMFRQLLDKHVLVSGQGPVHEIAKCLGFKRVSTIDTIRHAFPLLDNVDHRRRKAAPCAFEKYFPKVDVILLLGEPIRWETNLQIIIDMLVTNGQPSEKKNDAVPDPHIPVVACNMDFMWMSEACMPRFGHGCFLHCLESLYRKITGNTLRYTALVGKPSELTYSYCEIVLQAEARRLGLPLIRRIYCIGDNPESDIYGANLYDRYLTAQRLRRKRPKSVVQQQQIRRRNLHTDVVVNNGDSEESEESEERELVGSVSCESILVCTGIYSHAEKERPLHNHRDYHIDSELTTPTMTVQNVLEAVRRIYAKEGYEDL